jgi:2-polyprenyl-6-methoxyphenol hydroxylase-like FAD-dependent oxidoreductase
VALRAVVVGGGIGGIAAAVALARAGTDVQVHEQAQQLAEVGAGVSLAPNGLRMLERLGVGEAIRRVGARYASAQLRLPDGRAVPFLPEVAASSMDPLLLVTRRVPGTSLFEVAASIDRDRAGRQLACFLAALHQPSALERAEAAIGKLTGVHLQPATTTVLRDRFGKLEAGPARSAPHRHALVRLGRRRARLPGPGRARARRSAW